jgi:hypothetical protein
MPQKLKTSFTLTGMVVGVPVVTLHGLNWNPSRPVTPDFIVLTEAGYTVTANSTSITITRGANAPDTVTVLAESWHTFERAFGPVSTVVLSPQPIVIQGGGSSGVSSGVRTLRYTADGSETTAGFNVAIAPPMAAAYNVIVSMDACAFSLDFQSPSASNLLNQVTIIPGANMTAGDKIYITLIPV